MRNSKFIDKDNTRKTEELRGKSGDCSITEANRRKNTEDSIKCYLHVRIESKHAH